MTEPDCRKHGSPWSPCAEHAGGWTPTYHTTTKIDGRVIGPFQRPIPDPFARTTVTVRWRDLLRGLLRRRLVVEVIVGGDRPTEEAVLGLNHDYVTRWP